MLRASGFPRPLLPYMLEFQNIMFFAKLLKKYVPQCRSFVFSFLHLMADGLAHWCTFGGWDLLLADCDVTAQAL